MFKNIRTSRVSDKIVAQIKQLVLEEKLNAGDKLPPEPELAEQFSVSRTSVREALSILESQGIVERKKSEGTIIKRFSMLKLFESIVMGPKSDFDMFLDLMEARKLVEVSLLRFVVDRYDPEGAHRVEMALHMMEKEVCHGYTGVDSDILFHLNLAACANNQVLISIVKSISDMLTETRSKTLQVPGRLKICLEEHRLIWEAVQNKDLQLAQERMLAHLNCVIKIASSIYGQ